MSLKHLFRVTALCLVFLSSGVSYASSIVGKTSRTPRQRPSVTSVVKRATQQVIRGARLLVQPGKRAWASEQEHRRFHQQRLADLVRWQSLPPPPRF
jgi:hypothetical protein